LRRTISSICFVLLAGCSFGFGGGGLPRGLRTVAVNPFVNESADPQLGQQVTLAVKQAVESRLGLRSATPTQADVIVTGTVTRFDPDQPLAFHPSASVNGTASQVAVTQRQVELTVDILVVERGANRTLWDGKSLTVVGDYSPGREQEGRRKALDQLIKKLIDGVHQNW